MVGIFFGMVGVLIGLWAAAGSIALSGLAVFLAALFSPLLPWLMPELNAVTLVGAGFIGVGLAALGSLGCIGCYYLTKWFYKLTVMYLKFNIKIIRGGEGSVRGE